MQKQMINKPIFITFEGGEGCGKTTQSKLLQEYFVQQNMPCIWTREIGGTKNAEIIRDIIINNELNVRTELLLAMAARVEHVEDVIKPTITKGKIVICDRFVDSTAAYQGHCLGVDIVYNLHREIFGDLMPNLTFFFDMKPKKALERALSRGDNNKFEKLPLTFHEQVYETFLKIIALFPERFVIINAEQPIEVIKAQIIDIVKIRFGI